MKILTREYWKEAFAGAIKRIGFMKIPTGIGGISSGGIIGFSGLGSRRKQLEAYQNHVYKCVSLIYRRGISVPMKLYKERGDENEEIKRHPFIDLMRKPNQYMTGRILKAITMMHMDLCGMAMWLKVFNGLGRPAEVWPLPMQYFQQFKLNKEETEITGYEFMSEKSGLVTFVPEEIVYFRFPHPVYFLEGASPIQAMAFAYDTDIAIRKYQRNFFQNSARADVTLNTDQKIEPADAKRLLLAWKQNHQGVDRAFEPAILDQGLKATLLSVSAKDFEFATLAGWTKEDIFEAYGIPEGKLGTVKDVNRANGLQVDITFNSECISPRLDIYEEVVSNDVLSHYDTGLFAEHVSCIPRDLEYDLKERESNLKNKVTVVNEEREKMGLDPVAWGDKPWMSAMEIQYGEDLSVTDSDKSIQDVGVKNLSPDKKDSDRIRVEHERRVLAKSRAYRAYLRRFFTRQRKEVLERLDQNFGRIEGVISGMSRKKAAEWLEVHKDEVDRILFDISKANEDLAEGSGPYIENFLLDGAELAFATIGAQDVVFDLLDPRVLSWLREKEIVIKDINTTTLEALRKELIEGFTEGETMVQLARRVEKIFDNADKVRSLRIAVTETNSASNRGSLEGYIQSGVVEKKEWLAGPGARASHAAAAAKYKGDGAIPIDEDFIVGEGHGPAPGNIGLAEEDINCHCTLNPVVRRN